MVKLRLGTRFSDRFVYDSYLASGVTSHVFSGTFKTKHRNIRVAVKWLPMKYGIKEYIITQYIKRELNSSKGTTLQSHNILLPIVTFSEISFGDITTGKFMIKTLNASEGPRVTKKGTFGKNKKGMVLIFPLMETDLRVPVVGTTIDAVRQDVKTGLNILNDIRVMHTDVYTRNILIKDGKCYIGDLGGARILKKKKPYSNEEIEYLVVRLLRKVTINSNNKSRSRRR